MALSETTLGAACTAGASKITVASATGIAAGVHVVIDGEQMKVTKAYVLASTTVPVLRGQGGTAAVAHPSGARVTHSVASDFADVAPGGATSYQPYGRPRQVLSYSAAGAITLPVAGADMLAILNGTNALAMTLAHPTKDMDGCEVIIVGNGKAAHTVTLPTGGIGNAGAGYTVLTFASGAQNGIRLIACNEFWSALGAPGFAGTATALLETLS